MTRKKARRDFDEDPRGELIRRVKELYGVEPDHPFRTIPDAVVFRHAENKKWFGLLMTVKEKMLDGSAGNVGSRTAADAVRRRRETPDGPEAFGLTSGDRMLDILEVKLDPMLVSELRTQRGYHPGYHMNHENWLAIRLDGSVAVSEIETLLDMSFALTAGAGSGRAGRTGGAARMRAAGMSWIIPANPANYDVAAGFRREGTLVWHMRPHVLPGDLIYIYETMPLGCVLFKCEVVEADLPYESEHHPNVHTAMRIRLLRTYEEGQIDRAFLRKCGVTNIRSARSATPEFVRAVERLEHPVS